MRIAIFGGSFDPVHAEHVRYVRAARQALSLDRVVVMPSYLAPHKPGGASASGEDRLAMCRLAFADRPYVTVSDYELAMQGTSYTYLTVRRFAELYPDAERFFLVGADMLENFFSWREPEEILRHVTLVACGRGTRLPAQLHARFRARFGCDFTEVSFTGAPVSSTAIRVDLAFGKGPAALPAEVAAHIRAHGLYAYPAVAGALALEKRERQEHSYRVARLACERARALGIAERDALTAAGMHDCGKYVPLTSPMLAGFVPPEGVPGPVLHQFTGAYLAEHVFGVEDPAVLNAIRYHTSGRPEMTALEQLVFLADMLEEGRSFRGVEELRALFWGDLGVCLRRALEEQILYLEETDGPVYPLTREACAWAQRTYS